MSIDRTVNVHVSYVQMKVWWVIYRCTVPGCVMCCKHTNYEEMFTDLSRAPHTYHRVHTNMLQKCNSKVCQFQFYQVATNSICKVCKQHQGRNFDRCACTDYALLNRKSNALWIVLVNASAKSINRHNHSKVWGHLKVFNVFEMFSYSSSPRLHLFDHKYSKNRTIWNIITIKNNSFFM